jgi:hypothetical protein
LKYKFQLSLTVTGEPDPDKGGWDTRSIDVIQDTKLVSLLAQFIILIAAVHKRILEDYAREMQVIDDDIPF